MLHAPPPPFIHPTLANWCHPPPTPRARATPQAAELRQLAAKNAKKRAALQLRANASLGTQHKRRIELAASKREILGHMRRKMAQAEKAKAPKRRKVAQEPEGGQAKPPNGAPGGTALPPTALPPTAAAAGTQDTDMRMEEAMEVDGAAAMP